MKPCCEESIKRYVRRSRDVATCDGCGNLLLTYANPRDFEETEKTLRDQGVSFDSTVRGGLRIISKTRTPRP